MSNYMVEVGPGLGGTILMAVVGAVVVVAAEAAADRKIARIYWYLGGGAYVYTSAVARGLTSLVDCLSRKNTAKSKKK